jgi:hypothetical protein
MALPEADGEEVILPARDMALHMALRAVAMALPEADGELVILPAAEDMGFHTDIRLAQDTEPRGIRV